MKKVTAIILCLLMCFSLCSCKKIKAVKERQAFYDDGGIVYKGVLYKPVEPSDEINYTYTNQQNLFVTESGVSYLLYWKYGKDASMNDAGTIITYTNDGFDYVREDKYEEYLDSLENGINYTKLNFQYYNEELGENKDYILTDDEYTLFMSLLKGTPVTVENLSNRDYGYNHFFLLSDNELFRQYGYKVIEIDGSYYIIKTVDGKEMYYPSTTESDKMFKNFFENYGVYGYN
jgi:hypothetical protein